MNTREVVSVIVLNPDNKFVILKRSQNKSVHAKLWNLPSGGIEESETPEQACRREVLEETGLMVNNLIVGSIEIVETPSMNLHVNYVLGRTTSGQIVLNDENSEYKWVTPKESLDYEFAVPKKTVVRVLGEFKLL